MVIDAAGSARKGAEVPIACCEHAWAIGPDGVAYGTVHRFNDPSTMDLVAVSLAGVPDGFRPTTIDGNVSGPVFDAAGLIRVTVGSPSRARGEDPGLRWPASGASRLERPGDRGDERLVGRRSRLPRAADRRRGRDGIHRELGHTSRPTSSHSTRAADGSPAGRTTPTAGSRRPVPARPATRVAVDSGGPGDRTGQHPPPRPRSAERVLAAAASSLSGPTAA